MSMTLLQLVRQATAELGVPVPAAIVSDTTANVIQLLALTNAVGYELERERDWEAQTIEYRFYTNFLSTTGDIVNGSAVVTNISSTATLAANNWQVTGVGINTDTYINSVDSSTQVTLSQPCTATSSGTLSFSQTKYALPTGYDRLVDGTQWDKSQHWQMIGPETQQQVQWLKSGYISTGPRIRYYLLGSMFQIWPPMGIAAYLGFDYVNNLWVSSSGALQPDKTAFTADTDTCIFPDRLMILGLKLKYFEIKGFDTAAFYRDYQMQLNIAKANDAGSPTLAMAPQASNVLINWNNIPDSGYGGTES